MKKKVDVDLVCFSILTLVLGSLGPVLLEVLDQVLVQVLDEVLDKTWMKSWMRLGCVCRKFVRIFHQYENSTLGLLIS